MSLAGEIKYRAKTKLRNMAATGIGGARLTPSAIKSGLGKAGKVLDKGLNVASRGARAATTIAGTAVLGGLAGLAGAKLYKKFKKSKSGRIRVSGRNK